MCYEVKCSKCKKSTYGGCGKHLENLFRNIPYNQRCWCGYDNTEQIDKLIELYQAKGSSGPFPKK